MSQSKALEFGDLVTVTEKQVEYIGYVDDVDYDVRSLRVCVEFYPGTRLWFDMADVRPVKFPEPQP